MMATLQWLQNPSQINGNNLKNVIFETSRTFRNKGNIQKTKLMNLKQTARKKY
jgi:hypothetical protein